MNRTGGLVTNIVVLVVVFLVGTVAGWQILGNLFGSDSGDLSPEPSFSDEVLIGLCEEFHDEICGIDEVIAIDESDVTDLSDDVVTYTCVAADGTEFVSDVPCDAL